MQAVKKTVCYGVLLLMSCFTCLVLFGSGLITEAYGANDSYTPLTTYANFSLTKTIAGREFQEGDSFTFAIEPQDGAPDPDPGSISINPSSDHKYEYKPSKNNEVRIDFKEPGIYKYIISEKEPENPEPNMIYDKTQYTLEIVVEVDGADTEPTPPAGGDSSDDGDGNTTTTPPEEEGGQPGSSDGQASAGGTGAVPADGEPEPVGGNDGEQGTDNAAAALLTRNGSPDSGNDDNANTGKIDGTSPASDSTPRDLVITSYKVTCGEQPIICETDAAIKNHGSIKFGSPLEFKNTVNIPDPNPDPDPNPSYTRLTVKKEWVLDDGGSRPESVTVFLLRNGKFCKEATLNASNGWEHTWESLDDRYSWSVEETNAPGGFASSVSHQETVWTITNDDLPDKTDTPPELEEHRAPEEPRNPDSGIDSTPTHDIPDTGR